MATDQVVLMLYQNLNAMQPQLLKEVDDVQQKKGRKVFGKHDDGEGWWG